MYYTFRITGNEGASFFVHYEEDLWVDENVLIGYHMKKIQDRYKKFPELTNIKITYAEST